MIIRTVNVPQSYIDAMEGLVGETYPSRCELIREAIRQYLIKELNLAKSIKKFVDPNNIDKSFEKNGVLYIKNDNPPIPPLVNLPSKKIDEPEYFTYKVIRKLDQDPNSILQ